MFGGWESKKDFSSSHTKCNHRCKLGLVQEKHQLSLSHSYSYRMIERCQDKKKVKIKMTKCRICGVEFTGETGSIVMCKHHCGNVHLGCCIDCCSWDRKPCDHSIGIFEKV